MPDITHLLWVDLETTGLEVEFDEPIEIAVILSDMELNPLYTYSTVLKAGTYAIRRMLDNVIVKEMHEKSGLLPMVLSNEGEYPATTEGQIIEKLIQLGVQEGSTLLAGSGVGAFDKAFILKYFPGLFPWLQYPVIDVGVMRRFLRDVCLLPTLIPADGDASTKAHRALPDVGQHFEEAKHYRETFRTLFGQTYLDFLIEQANNGG